MVLIALGVLLWIIALGLAFTIVGVISALLGLAWIVVGAIWLALGTNGRGAAPDRHT